MPIPRYSRSSSRMRTPTRKVYRGKQPGRRTTYQPPRRATPMPNVYGGYQAPEPTRAATPNVYGGYVAPKPTTYRARNIGMPNVYGGYMNPPSNQNFWGTVDWRSRLAYAGQPRRWSYTGADRNLWGMAPELYKSSVEAARARYYGLPTAYHPDLLHPYLRDPATDMSMPTWESLFPNVPAAGPTLAAALVPPAYTIPPSLEDSSTKIATYDEANRHVYDKSKFSPLGPIGELDYTELEDAWDYGGYGGGYPYYGGGGGGSYKNTPSYRAETSGKRPGRVTGAPPQPTVRASGADMRNPRAIQQNMSRWMQLLTTWRI